MEYLKISYALFVGHRESVQMAECPTILRSTSASGSAAELLPQNAEPAMSVEFWAFSAFLSYALDSLDDFAPRPTAMMPSGKL